MRLQRRLFVRLARLNPLRHGPPELVRRGRLLLALATIVFASAASYAALYAVLGCFAAVAAVSISMVVPVVVVADFQRQINLTRSAHMLVGGGFATMVGVTYVTGGVDSPAIVWMGVVPLLISMAAGWREGIPWAVATCVAIAAEWAGSSVGLVPQTTLPAAWEVPFHVACDIGVTVVLFVIAASYESSREAAAAQLEQARAAAASAHDTARAAHTAARAVLDHVDVGLAIIDASGRLGPERSLALDSWLGRAADDATADAQFARAPAFARDFAAAWQQVADDFIPRDVALDQLPAAFELDGRHFKVRARDGGDGTVLLVVRDVSAEVAAERERATQRELVQLFQRLGRDRGSVVAFRREARRLVAQFEDESQSSTVARRALHTLKGNAALFGLERMAAAAHAVEQDIAEREEAPARRGDGLITDEHRVAVRNQWAGAEALLQTLLHDEDDSSVRLERATLSSLAADLELAGDAETARRLRELLWDPVAPRLAMLGEQAVALGRRLEKPPIDVVVSATTRVAPHEGWDALWSSLAHVVRNAVDHGIESADVRAARGKPERARLEFSANPVGQGLVLRIGDDGGGVDWDTIFARARAMGCHTDDPVAALCADGVSTRTEVTSTSGRGIGMAAVASAVAALGGTLDIESVRGEGTTFVMRFRDRAVGTVHAAAAMPVDVDDAHVDGDAHSASPTLK